MDTEIILRIIIIGLGATLCMDIWAFVLKRFFRTPSLDYSLVGRWLLSMFDGQFRHQKITATPTFSGEKIVGWAAHYIIGVIFATLPLFISGTGWLSTPELVTALLSGLLSLTAPFLIMQPALGFGIAASKVPNPAKARVLSVCAHTIFGMGLFITAKALSEIWR